MTALPTPVALRRKAVAKVALVLLSYAVGGVAFYESLVVFGPAVVAWTLGGLFVVAALVVAWRHPRWFL